MLRIRDPIHGSIRVNRRELSVVDHRGYQRLRNIRQLGFAEMAFPGATHNRYAHGLGAMHIAGLIFDQIFPQDKGYFQSKDRERLRQALRFALLLHDIGHAPASHACEQAMPQLSALGLEHLGRADLAGASRKATHEDYTTLLLLGSALTPVLRAALADVELEPEAIAHLISGGFERHAQAFVVAGIDYGPLLSQIVSGELDADRMDYLQRDAHFAGVAYGRFDQQWLLDNLGFHVEADRAWLAISHRAVFAFEDFLLSRFHMFVSVYQHYIPVGFDHMLRQLLLEEPTAFALPAEAEAYLETDDVTLWSALRRSNNEWAKRLVGRQLYRRVFEANAQAGVEDGHRIEAALTEAGIKHFVSSEQGVLSKYYGLGSTPESLGERPIFVRHKSTTQVRRVEDYSHIFERYAQPAPLIRIYTQPEDAERARTLVQRVARGADER